MKNSHFQQAFSSFHWKTKNGFLFQNPDLVGFVEIMTYFDKKNH